MYGSTMNTDLVVLPAWLKRYKLKNLIDGCDLKSARSAEEEACLQMAPVGQEVAGPDSTELGAGLSGAVMSDKPVDEYKTRAENR